MVNRKSMGAAFTLSPEKLAFIQGDQKVAGPTENVGPPTSGEGTGESGNSSSMSPPGGAKAEFKNDAAANADQAPLVDREIRRKTRKRSDEVNPTFDIDTAEDDLPPLLISLTTRLRPTTAEALRRASLELRLRRRKLHKQQDIIEAALQSWLKTNGFAQTT